KVDKVCLPANDTGKFNLQIDGQTAGTGADAVCGGTTGALISSVGAHTVGETPGTGTNLNDYTTAGSDYCDPNVSITIAAGQNAVTTIPYTTLFRSKVDKVCLPANDTGKFNLQIDGQTAGTGADAVCGGTTGALLSSIGAHSVGETAGTGTNL